MCLLGPGSYSLLLDFLMDKHRQVGTSNGCRERVPSSKQCYGNDEQPGMFYNECSTFEAALTVVEIGFSANGVRTRKLKNLE